MIYLDHNATSPLHPAVREAMAPWLSGPFNASSVHTLGRRAAAAVDEAAHHVARLVGRDPREVVFTSGATEANALWFHAVRHRSGRVFVGSTEHPSVLAVATQAERLAVDPTGRHHDLPAGIAGASILAVNHETGVISDLQRLLYGDGWRHVDATAAAGRIRLELGGADAITLSAHKIGGPPGVGALVASDLELEPMFPGSQQRGRRGGTLNTPGIVGFGVAAKLALEELDARRERWAALKARLVATILRLGGEVVGENTVPSVVDAVFPGLPAETLVQALDLRGIATSAGSACASGSVHPSPVLEAMGHPEPSGGLRFSFGWSTATSDIVAVEQALPDVLEVARLFL